MSTESALSPSQRLDRSRQAIVRYMAYDELEAHGPSGDHGSSAGAIDGSASSWGVFKQVAASWWRGHPAHLALDIAKPLLQTYAADKPLQLLGISAGLGAAAVLLRPWRLISLAGLAATVMKSTPMSGVVHSLLSAGRKPDQLP
jgi:hypothetical protein